MRLRIANILVLLCMSMQAAFGGFQGGALICLGGHHSDAFHHACDDALAAQFVCDAVVKQHHDHSPQAADHCQDQLTDNCENDRIAVAPVSLGTEHSKCLCTDIVVRSSEILTSHRHDRVAVDMDVQFAVLPTMVAFEQPIELLPSISAAFDIPQRGSPQLTVVTTTQLLI